MSIALVTGFSDPFLSLNGEIFCTLRKAQVLIEMSVVE
jgi:hypothetical protein